MSSAIAFLAGLGTGYNTGADQKQARDRQDKLDQITFDEAAARKDARGRAAEQEQQLADAAKPIPVDQSQLQGPPADGQDAMPTTYKVGAQRFASAADASDAAQSQTRDRVANVLAQSDPIKADQYRLSGMRIDAAKADMIDKQFDSNLLTAAQKGPQGIIDFTNASGASPTQSRFVLGPDGKTGEVHMTLPDGTDRPTGMVYSNDAAGARDMALDLSKKVPMQAKIAHYQAEEANKRQVDYQQGMLRISQQNANTQEAYRSDQADNMRQQRALESQRIAALTAKQPAPGQPVQLSLKDLKDFDDDVNKRVTEIFQPKEGMTPDERGTLGDQRNAVVAQANGIFQANATKGIPLTAGIVLQALSMASDPANVKRLRDNHGSIYATVAVNGQPVIVSTPLIRRQAPPAPTPAAGGRPLPAAIAARGVPVASAPAAPPGPLSTLPTATLEAMASSPRNRGFQEARAELDRRAAGAPDPRMSDPQYDPRNYR